MITRAILSIVIFPSAYFIFLISYFWNNLDKPGSFQIIVILFLIVFVPCVIVFVFPYTGLSKRIDAKKYYNVMKWNKETIAEYEEDLRIHERQVKKWKNMK